MPVNLPALSAQRQEQAEYGALPRLGSDGNAPAVGFHDLVHGGKPEPGPQPHGGEIGIENMRQGVRRDAHPGIPDFEAQGIGFGMLRQEEVAAVRHGF